MHIWYVESCVAALFYVVQLCLQSMLKCINKGYVPSVGDWSLQLLTKVESDQSLQITARSVIKNESRYAWDFMEMLDVDKKC